MKNSNRPSLASAAGRVSNAPFRAEGLKQVLLAAAGIVRGHYQRRLDATRKPDGSLLTEADLQSNAFLKRALLDLLPGAGWLSEESADDAERLSRDWVWIVDPLDGTREFTRGRPEFAVSIGLAHQREVVAGAVVNPVTQEGGLALHGEVEFWGWDAAAPEASHLGDAVASVSRSEVQDEGVKTCSGFVRETRAIGSIAYKLLRVAARQEDLTFSLQPKSEWDICGGVALLRAASREYRRSDGSALRFNQARVRSDVPAVAGPAALVEEFLSRFDALGREFILASELAPG